MKLKKVPIGIQTFHKIINGDYLYIDKTKEILNLIDSGDYLFISRPRRFGKSLLISTLKEIFQGKKELFKGLYIYDKIPWQRYPVIHLDLSIVPRENDEILVKGLKSVLKKLAAEHDLSLTENNYYAIFQEFIIKLNQKYQKKVIILIDEYDKPIVDLISDISEAEKNREVIKRFYSILKGNDQYLHFVLLTGVSKFSRVSIFSGLNNLKDITLTPGFNTLLGITQSELEDYFKPYISDLCIKTGCHKADVLKKIQRWYNGYSWDGREKIYNPFSLLNLFADNKFSNYWFATGTPSFLLEIIKKKQIQVIEFENKSVTDIIFDSYDLDNINPFSLLFQTGYLTIDRIDTSEEITEYILNFPNFEVKTAFLTYIFDSFTENRIDEIPPYVNKLRRYLRSNKIEEFIKIIRIIFARIPGIRDRRGIPSVLHLKKEAYYHSLFYMILSLTGFTLDIEVLTDKGRIDGVLELEKNIYIVEFKYGEDKDLLDQAIRQIRDRKYFESYLDRNKDIFLLAVRFATRDISYKLVALDSHEKFQ